MKFLWVLLCTSALVSASPVGAKEAFVDTGSDTRIIREDQTGIPETPGNPVADNPIEVTQPGGPANDNSAEEIERARKIAEAEEEERKRKIAEYYANNPEAGNREEATQPGGPANPPSDDRPTEVTQPGGPANPPSDDRPTEVTQPGGPANPPSDDRPTEVTQPGGPANPPSDDRANETTNTSTGEIASQPSTNALIEQDDNNTFTGGNTGTGNGGQSTEPRTATPRPATDQLEQLYRDKEALFIQLVTTGNNVQRTILTLKIQAIDKAILQVRYERAESIDEKIEIVKEALGNAISSFDRPGILAYQAHLKYLLDEKKKREDDAKKQQEKDRVDRESCKVEYSNLTQLCSTTASWNQYVSTCDVAYKNYTASASNDPNSNNCGRFGDLPRFEKPSGGESSEFLACKNAESYLVQNCSTTQNWNTNANACQNIHEVLTGTQCNGYVSTMPFLKPSGGESSDTTQCRPIQQSLVNNCGTAEKWSASGSDCRGFYNQNYNKYCGNLASEFPFTPPVLEKTAECRESYTTYVETCRGGRREEDNSTDCNALQDNYTRICGETTSVPRNNGGTGVSGSGTGAGDGTGTGTGTGEGTGIDGSNRFSTSPNQSDGVNIDGNRVNETQNGNNPSETEGGVPANDNSERETTPSVRPVITQQCSNAESQMVDTCNIGMMTRACEEASQKKREVCDGEHFLESTRIIQRTAEQSVPNQDSPAVQNYNKCKEQWTQMNETCQGASGSVECTDIKENYMKDCKSLYEQ